MMQVSIKANTYIYLTILLLIIPIHWIVSWFVAVIIHEFCHFLGVKLCGGKVYKIEIGLCGANMICSTLSDIGRFFAILCGPLGGLILACFGKWIPRVALCSFFLSVYNLYPILPFDGGRLLRILIKSDRVFKFLQQILILIVIFAAIFATFFLRLGVLPFAVAIGIWLKNRKIPCKEAVCRVQ